MIPANFTLGVRKICSALIYDKVITIVGGFFYILLYFKQKTSKQNQKFSLENEEMNVGLTNARIIYVSA